VVTASRGVSFEGLTRTPWRLSGVAESPLLLPVRAAAAELGIGRDTTYALIHEGRLRVLRLGRRLLVPQAELERFIERELGNGDGHTEEVVPLD
jgi:excisionase family DNA binding protein